MEIITFSSLHSYVCLALSVLNGITCCFVSYKFFQIIQLSGYNLKSYFVWIKDTKGKYISRLFMLSFLSTACLLATNVLFDAFTSNLYLSYMGVVFYFIFSFVFIKYLYEAPKKTPLKYTRRMNRLITFFFIGITALTFILLAFSFKYLNVLRFTAISIIPIMLPILVPVVHLFMIPLEELIKCFYITKAKKKLKKLPSLIKIGITGSYGKTSTKEILKTILSEKYKVCATPFSYNTPMGLTKTIISYLQPNHEVFIAEMGAKKVGEIAQLCRMIKPQVAVLTSVGKQHLKTFKTPENIEKAKYEIIQGLDDGGLGVFNANNEIVENIYNETSLKNKFCSKLNSSLAYVSANEVSINSDGLKFKLRIDKKETECSTKLLGEHNLENILTCCVVASKLGLSLKQISSGISKIEPIKHRLELINSDNGVIILDDSFNSNPQGSESALRVLNLFQNNRKIIATPGLIELGASENDENEKFGEKMAKVADICIIINTHAKESLVKGILSTGFDEKNLYCVENLDKAKELFKQLLKQNDVLLLENDLPDNYT